jgi:MFS superfamily sulfate permease-like transporter
MVVALMMAAGSVLRHSTLPRALLGAVYVTIGWALFMSSRHAWFSWHHGV